MTAAEEQPLLQTIPEDIEDGTRHTEIILDFDPNGDTDNPREWPVAFKWTIVILLAFMAFTVTFTCISVVPVAGSIVEDLNHGHSNPSDSALLVTIWELGEAAGPLLIAPLSEVFGRYPVMNTCNILFILATLLAAMSRNTPLFIAARALTGLSVASNVLNPAIIGDMFASEQRGSPMSVIMLAPLIGGAVGPAVSGAIAQTLGWREVLFIAAGLACACEIQFLACFRETYKMTILRGKVAKMKHKSVGNHSHTSNDQHPGRKLWYSVTRPFTVVFGSGVLIALSVFGSVGFSYFYVVATTLPTILEDIYGFSPALTGTAFMSFSVGSAISVMICNFSLDRMYVRLRTAHKGEGKPEYRLPLTIIGAFALPAIMAAYGWIAYFQLHVSVLLVSVGLVGLTLLLTVIPLSAYVVDAFGLYSASAMTGMIVTRCLMGTFLPLTVAPLVGHLGYGWGFTCLGGLSLCLAPIPVFVLIYGEKWRQLSEFTKDRDVAE